MKIKERELLKKLFDAINLLDYRQGLDPLTCEIEELLAQPEQELMTSRAIIQACPEHYCDMEKDAFRVGINWYEKYVARIGVYSNEQRIIKSFD